MAQTGTKNRDMSCLAKRNWRSLNRTGVLVVEDVVTDALPAVRAEYEALMDELWAGWVAEGQAPEDIRSFDERVIYAARNELEYFQPMDISLPTGEVPPGTPFHAGPAVFAMMRHPRLLDLVEQLIGPEITSNPIQHVRIKPPADDVMGDEERAHIVKTDWHQDRGVTQVVADKTDMITVWIAVSDATEQNGCLQAMDGAPTDELLPHCHQVQVGIPGQFIDTSRVRALPVKAGGVVILHPMTPHASLDNVTKDSLRWSFDLRYNVTGQPTGRAQFPEFVARSRKDPSAELRSAKAWWESWYEARERLAKVPVTEFYRWDNNAPYCA